MFQNDWYLKREAEERIKSRLRDANASRLAKLASETQQYAYQRFLVRLGGMLSQAGEYLQIHFGDVGASQSLTVASTHPGRRIDCP